LNSLRPNQIPEHFNDDIDFFDVIESLWREKVIIILITAVAALLGGLVAFNTPATYRATVTMLPPSLSGIAELSKLGDFVSSAGSKQSLADLQSVAFDQFLQILNSSIIRQEFLRDNELRAALFKRTVSAQERLKVLAGLVEVKNPKNGHVTLTFDAPDPNLAAKSANKFVELAIVGFRSQANESFNALKNQDQTILQSQLDSLIMIHEERIDAELKKLSEALRISKTLNLVKPLLRNNVTFKFSAQSSSAVPDDTPPIVTEELRYLYSQGSEALQAEIEVVGNRKGNLLLVSGAVEKKRVLDALSAKTFDPSALMPVTIDSSAEPPETRLKPRRSLIIILWCVVGSILAVVFVLLRNAVRARKVVP